LHLAFTFGLGDWRSLLPDFSLDGRTPLYSYDVILVIFFVIITFGLIASVATRRLLRIRILNLFILPLLSFAFEYIVDKLLVEVLVEQQFFIESVIFNLIKVVVRYIFLALALARTPYSLCDCGSAFVDHVDWVELAVLEVEII
jgi:hypothetical protein